MYKKRFFNKKSSQNAGTISVADLLRAVDESKLKAAKAPTETTYSPIHKFNDFAVSQQLKENVLQKNYTQPTPIQDKVIPLVLEGRDVIGIANTGTGKTAAFLIPLIDKVFKDTTQKVLILAPTRELAFQIDEEFKAFSKGMRMRAVLCIGGSNMFTQKKLLTHNPNFIIGTPGRIKDLIRQRALNISTFKNVVLDEADRMVDIGFIREIKTIISFLPKERQSLFFSATVSDKVREILNDFVQNPVTVSVKQKEASENVKQEVVRVPREKKLDTLHDLLIQEEFNKTLIFGRTKHGVQKLSNELVSRGFKAEAIHGNKRQNQRLAILNRFKKDEINILLATDVASRGLDIDNVTHVINFDLPGSLEDYIHRIGRTGRGDKVGTAISFID